MKEDCGKEMLSVNTHLETRAKHVEWQENYQCETYLGQALMQFARAT